MAVLTTGGDITVSAVLTGGAGGNGGNGVFMNTSAAGGGDGGTALWSLTSGQHITIDANGSLIGGAGGNGGKALDTTTAALGQGGGGGSGLTMSNGTLTNAGTIAGGAGGKGGEDASAPGNVGGGSGGGGYGVAGSNLNVINSGTISGGLFGDGSLRNYALFLFGNNRLEIQQGSVIVGKAYVIGGTSTLALGGSADQSFDMSLIGSNPSDSHVQYVGFSNFEKTGTGTATLTGTNTFAGPTQINQGTLNVLSTLSGPVTVAQGGVLAGTGTVGTTNINSGGMLSPGDATGNSPGVLKVNGNLTMASGSTLRILSDVTTQTASKVEVSGTANVAGTLASISANGNYTTAVPYSVMSAGGGITGNFDHVASDLAFLDGKVTNNGNELTLTLQRKEVTDPGAPSGDDAGGTAPQGGTTGGGASGGTSGGSGGTRPMTFADAAGSRNQRAAANALESLGSGNALYRQVENLAAGQPQSVFKALSGEAHASTAATLRAGADTARALPLEHFRANLSANLLAGAPTAQAGTSDVASNLGSLPASSAKPAWAQLYGTWQTFGGGGDAARVTQNTTGIFVGGDQAVGGGWRAGGALGYGETHSRAGEVSSKADISNYSATVYGGRSFATGAGRLNFLAGGSYTWHDIDTNRSIDTSGFSQSLKSSYGASTGQLFTELGYALPVTGALTLEPFAGVAWSDLRTRGFSESGGSAALSGEGDRNTLTTTTLGLRSRTSFALGSLEGTLRGTLGWRHAFGDVTTHSTLAFQGSDSFTVAGVPQARDGALVELSADVAVSRNVSLGLAYGGEFGGGNTQNSGMINLAWRF
ncbi:autotransporter outer membrane beta-barrel domain-containing protein [Achromobacter sp. HZ28]|nr:autotransporter outer membrane beta-barrel domain-containing protein [Achromobacter sp. HZ34]OWT81296.1 autotransporter outer membrane beta-barrel domain-containing protein [Achromobacter sp. HZ28]